jgi:hypothetical protein
MTTGILILPLLTGCHSLQVGEKLRICFGLCADVELAHEAVAVPVAVEEEVTGSTGGKCHQNDETK